MQSMYAIQTHYTTITIDYAYLDNMIEAYNIQAKIADRSIQINKIEENVSASKDICRSIIILSSIPIWRVIDCMGDLRE